mmetsp:Transcript_30598/g.88917  ORF Transcript_30598/g.88917 Transcript_30598/m.88917 type:complete len:114 (-) Transcript_30598:646-987(-)
MSSAWLPLSTTWPLSMQRILSAWMTVDSRWAITTRVALGLCSGPSRSSKAMALARLSRTASSLRLSRALVASSRTSTRGLATRARAIAIRCRCPPLSWVPWSPTYVSYPAGNP